MWYSWKCTVWRCGHVRGERHHYLVFQASYCLSLGGTPLHSTHWWSGSTPPPAEDALPVSVVHLPHREGPSLWKVLDVWGCQSGVSRHLRLAAHWTFPIKPSNAAQWAEINSGCGKMLFQDDKASCWPRNASLKTCQATHVILSCNAFTEWTARASISICLVTFAFRGRTGWDDSYAIHFLSEDSTGTTLSRATIIFYFLLMLYIGQMTNERQTLLAAHSVISSCSPTDTRCIRRLATTLLDFLLILAKLQK